jgi:hypothetical protein
MQSSFYYYLEILMNSPIYVKVNCHPHYDGLSGHDVDIVGQLTLQYLTESLRIACSFTYLHRLL